MFNLWNWCRHVSVDESRHGVVFDRGTLEGVRGSRNVSTGEVLAPYLSRLLGKLQLLFGIEWNSQARDTRFWFARKVWIGRSNGGRCGAEVWRKCWAWPAQGEALFGGKRGRREKQASQLRIKPVSFESSESASNHAAIQDRAQGSKADQLVLRIG